jgi:hypothetical protein
VPFCLLKIISFRLVQIDQQIAEIPIRINVLSFLFTPFSQLPNILVILEGGGILYAKNIIRQTILAKGQ